MAFLFSGCRATSQTIYLCTIFRTSSATGQDFGTRFSIASILYYPGPSSHRVTSPVNDRSLRKFSVCTRTTRKILKLGGLLMMAKEKGDWGVLWFLYY